MAEEAVVVVRFIGSLSCYICATYRAVRRAFSSPLPLSSHKPSEMADSPESIFTFAINFAQTTDAAITTNAAATSMFSAEAAGGERPQARMLPI